MKLLRTLRSWLRLLLAWLPWLGLAPRWVKLNPMGTAPPPRWQHTAVYDATSNRLVVFGGKTTPDMNFNDLWVLVHASGLGGTPAWVALNPTGTPPSQRHMHSAVFDPASNRMIVFGGHSDSGPFLNDVWVLEHASGLGGTPAWLKLVPKGSMPDAREWHSAVYDSKQNLMLVFGGKLLGGKSLNDVWALRNANGLGGIPSWSKLTPSGTPPAPRVGHSAVYDAAGDWMLLFGGSGDGFTSFLSDVWVLRNASGVGGAPAWAKVSAAGAAPPARELHRAAQDPSSNRMVVFGGAGSKGSFFSDVWVLLNATGD